MLNSVRGIVIRGFSFSSLSLFLTALRYIESQEFHGMKWLSSLLYAPKYTIRGTHKALKNSSSRQRERERENKFRPSLWKSRKVSLTKWINLVFDISFLMLRTNTFWNKE